MSLLLILFCVVQFFVGLLTGNLVNTARGLLGGIVGLQVFNCLAYANEPPLLDVKYLLSVQVVAFSIANAFDVAALPSVLPLMFVVVAEYFPLEI